MAYLFDTEAISETMRRVPSAAFMRWLGGVPRVDQFTSAVVVGELYKGAFRSDRREVLLRRLDDEVLPRLTVLPYTREVARIYGEIRADLEAVGNLPGELDLLIGATALAHGLDLVTGNVEHFQRIKGLSVEPILARARPPK